MIVQILLALLAISFLVAWHELGHYLVARLSGMRVLKFSIGFGPKIWGFTRQGIEYQLSLIPVGGFVQIAGMIDSEESAQEDSKSFINRPKWAQFLTVFAGPFSNYLMAFLLFFSVFWFWSSGTTPSILVNQVVTESPAAVAGLQSGDVIVQIDGQNPSGTRDFLSRISKGQPLNFKVHRDTVELDITVIPKMSESGEYKMGVAYVPLSFSFKGAVLEALTQCWVQSVGILTQLGSALMGKTKDLQLGGVIEITRQLSNAAEQGLKNFLAMMAGLSVVLGLFNILPIPSLDGSKLLMILIEGVTRRKIPEKAQIGIQIVGLVFILGLMILLTIGDVMRLYSGVGS
jgi:regulator of sigma E protease